MGPTLVVLAVVAIVVRGQMGEQWGERSLLFRWHYTLGAWAVWLQQPWLGAGPAGFAEAYLAARPDRAPEEVLSAHSMWLDWLATLGVAALAWSALALAWVWQGCRRAERVGTSAEPASLGRRFVVVALGTVLVMTLASMLAELHMLDSVGLVARPVGLALGLALAVAAVPEGGKRVGVWMGFYLAEERLNLLSPGRSSTDGANRVRVTDQDLFESPTSAGMMRRR